MASQISYEEFVTLLQSMVKRRETGSLFVRTDGNHIVIIGIDRGEIVGIASGAKRGADALATIMDTRSCAVQVDPEMIVDFHRGQLPVTEEIIYRLNHRVAMPQASSSDLSNDGVSPLNGGGKASSLDPVLTGSMLCELLQDYLGPVASMICDEVTESGKTLCTPEQLAKAIEVLAQEIDSPPEAKDFTDRAYQQFGHWLR